jgi:hypothetical protein
MCANAGFFDTSAKCFRARPEYGQVVEKDGEARKESNLQHTD